MSIDYFVGQLLDVTLSDLLHQVEIEIKFSKLDEIDDQVARLYHGVTLSAKGHEIVKHSEKVSAGFTPAGPQLAATR